MSKGRHMRPTESTEAQRVHRQAPEAVSVSYYLLLLSIGVTFTEIVTEEMRA